MGGDGLALSVRILGPIRAVDADDRDVTPDGPLQRRLLALLVLRRGTVVSADQAIEAMWPTGSPRDPGAALQTHLFRLRRSLPPEIVQSVGDGYRLDAGRVDVDADRLAAWVAAGEGDPATAAWLDDLLADWHGPAYPELADVDEGRAAAGPLDDLRARAIEIGAAAQLAAGHRLEATARLVALTDDHPLRERPRALLMAALDGDGRRVDALRVYDDFRRLLAAELGISPSPALQRQHALLLGARPTSIRTPHRRTRNTPCRRP